MVSKIRINAFLQRLLPLFLLLLLVITGFYAYGRHLDRDAWVMGDWLINYQGGFVRRGLTGEGILHLSRFLSVNPGIVISVITTFFYAIYFTFSYLLLRTQKTLLPYIFLIFSPFIFLFQISNYNAGYRKETIYIAVLSFLVWAARRYSKAQFERVFYLVLLIFPLLILSHEMLAIWLPYLMIVYLNKVELTKKRVGILLILLGLSVFTFFATISTQATEVTVSLIHASISGTGYVYSDGAIAILSQTARTTVEENLTRYTEDHYIWFYTQTVALSTIAVLPIRRNIKAAFTGRLTKVALVVSFLGTVLLSVVAFDWGRFIYLHLVSLFLLSLLVSRPSALGADIPVKRVVLVGIAVLIYASTWYIPHFVNDSLYRFL